MMMLKMKFKHKPTIIDAERKHEKFTIHTLEGTMIGNPGDYLVTGIRGEQYPVAKAIFEDIYEPVSNGVAERNRNDGQVITLDDEHIIFSKLCPNDPVDYDLNTAICKKDGSVWIRIGAFT